MSEGEAQGNRSNLKTRKSLGYNPGEPVEDTPEQQSDKKKRKTQSKGTSLDRTAKKGKHKASLTNTGLANLMEDLLDKYILEPLINARAVKSVIMLSMVNKACHQAISTNSQAWFRMYTQWRGPIAPPPTHIRTPRGLIVRMPTIPRNLPNFRDIGVSIS
jgi:hypothetical protein